MRYKFVFAALSVLSACLLFSGCQSDDYYKDKAVQKARKFILDQDRTLNLHQREYVKFNKPVIMAGEIIGELPNERSSAIMAVESQVCIAWVIPGCKDAYIVFGVSDNHLRGWSPNRLIIKSYKRPDHELIEANRQAVMFAANNFLYLSAQMLNRIRFTVPKVYDTNFYTESKLFGDTPEKQKANKLAYSVQKSFVWPSTRKGWVVFVCGASTNKLSGWKPLFGQETTLEDLNSHIINKGKETEKVTEKDLADTSGCPLLTDKAKLESAEKTEAVKDAVTSGKDKASESEAPVPVEDSDKKIPEPETETEASKAMGGSGAEVMSAVKGDITKPQSKKETAVPAKSEPQVEIMSAVKGDISMPAAKKQSMPEKEKSIPEVKVPAAPADMISSPEKLFEISPQTDEKNTDQAKVSSAAKTAADKNTETKAASKNTTVQENKVDADKQAGSTVKGTDSGTADDTTQLEN
ncbi:hypothetical protein P0136_05345 [Lentisphaerota bacterium ZTH]|nr:hypothetical protein JYG24_03540 [Lentisphaerota bacterium]WET07416.1 hypothetical protein P0136_05345 [Lentisphaerota bacterium ZTH]